MNDVDRRSILQGAIGAISLAQWGRQPHRKPKRSNLKKTPPTGAGKKPL
jgi:hypothetical protein